MTEFFSRYGGSLLIGAALLAVIVFVIIKLYKNKRKGKNSCGCGCGNCPASGMCHKKYQLEEGFKLPA